MKKAIKIGGLVLLGILVLWTFFFLWQKSRPKQKEYNIEVVQKNDILKKTVATGKVQPRNEILIKPQMSGIISAIYKQAGDKVNTGDIIAKIKVIPDMVNLSSAESRVQHAKLTAEQSAKTFARDKALFEKNIISKEEYEKSQLQYQNDRLELTSATDNLSLVRDGISKSSSAYSTTLVRSTVSGTILDVPVKAGNSVIQSNNFNDGTTIASVANLSDMLFVGKIDESEVGKLSVDMPMDITIGAIQDRKIPARLEYVSPKGTEENGAILFEMKAAIKMPGDLFIRAGYSANAEIVLAKAMNVLSIPETCVQFSGDSAFVYVVKDEKQNTFDKKRIQVGLSDGINIQVKSGLKLKDKVRGNEKTNKK